ncbi:hypothetical protein RHECNPAF_7500119 [Rhizobium etli CNPAF512]|nr:hypothetical protein RHECNPAF_7500119 [Rhizobium etli CNPAF512]
MLAPSRCSVAINFSEVVMALFPLSLVYGACLLCGAGWTIENAAAEETCRQFHQYPGALATIVEKRIELDEIERRDETAVGQHFHDQMGLAEGRAARHRRADAGGNIGIEEIEIEADMQQAVGLGDDIENIPHDGGDALFVDRAHIEDVDTVFVDFFALARIDRTDADLEDMFRIDEGTVLRQDLGELRLAAEEGDRHAVNIAGGGGGRRIEIGMGIEPEHEERATLVGGVTGHAGDAAHGKAVVAAENERKAAGGGDIIDAAFESASEGADGSQIVGLGMIRQVHRRYDPEIAVIRDIVAEIDQRLVDAGDAQRRGAHGSTSAAGALLQWCADEGDRSRLDIHARAPC